MKPNFLRPQNSILFYAFFAGVAFSIASLVIVGNWEKKAILGEFNTNAADRVKVIENTIADNNAAFMAIGSFYRASHRVERDEFRNFTEGLLLFHPDILEFRWLLRVKDSEGSSYEESMRKEGFTGLVIKEFDPEYNLRTATKRSEYFCVTYVAPAPGYSNIFGVDASSDPLRWEQMRKARDTGKIFGTASIRLIGDQKTDFACRFFLPIYRNELPHNTIEERRENLLGFAVLVFRIGDVVDLSLKGLPEAGIDTYIYDKRAKPGARILYFRPSRLNKTSKALSEEELIHQKGLQYSVDLDVAGNAWSVICLATPEFLLAHRRYGSWVFLSAGLVLTILGASYLFNIINRSAQVEALVKVRTDELNKANALCEALLKTIPFPMDIVDEEGNIMYINDNMKVFAGKNAVGKKCWWLYRDDKEQCSDCPLIGGIKIGETRTIESAGVFVGRIFQISHTGMLFNGKRAVLEVFRDITAQSRADEWLRELSTAVEQSPASVVITDTEGNMEYVNPKFTRLTGYTMEEIKGKTPGILKSGEHTREFYKDLWDTIESGNEWHGELHNKKKNGELYWELALISPVKNSKGDIIHFIAIKEDITQRKKIEEELLQANEKLMKLDKLKTEFVSTVSHELRTPLSITKEGISLVIDKIPGKINEKQEKILVTARDNIDRLARIINELLDISKIEAGRVVLKKAQVDILDIVRHTVSFFEPKIKEKCLKIKTDLPEKGIDVYVDEDKIIQVLSNLLSNALKFTTKGFIEISVRELKDTVECSVLDTGAGIAQEDMPKAFNKFQQFDRVTGAGEKGTGLGLSIAKSLVEMHKGNIYVESKAGKGSKFTFTLLKYDSGRVFKENIDEGIKDAIKKDSKLSLIVISIVNSEQVRKSFSAEKISSVLKGLAVMLRNGLHRETDIVAKDTFEIIVLLPDCNKENALIVEGRLKQILSEYLESQDLRKAMELHFGCATFPDEGKSDEELIEKAKA